MPCPPPHRETKAASLREAADFKAKQLAEKKAEAIRLHRVLKEPHNVIMSRLKISRPTLVEWLREADLDGYSVRPEVEKNVHGANAMIDALREREALAAAVTNGASRAGAFNRPRGAVVPKNYMAPSKRENTSPALD